MATKKTCDVCGTSERPVFTARVAIEIVAAVDKEGSTGVIHEIDSCEPCWPKAIGDMSSNVTEQLFKDIPVHRKVYAINDEIAVLEQDRVRAVRERDALADDAPERKGAVQRVEEVVANIEKLEQKRQGLLINRG